MVRTTKKNIEQEIKSRRCIEIQSLEAYQNCIANCKYIAYSRGVNGLTGIVFCDLRGNLYATTSRKILE